MFIALTLISCGGGGGGGSSTSPATLVSIEISPSNPRVILDNTQQFIATGTYSDSTTRNITAIVTWSSSEEPVATINASSGLATAVSEGTTTITAASGSVSATATLTVVTITSIEVTPSNQSISLGAGQQFTATGTFSDSSTQILTNVATWSSSSPSVATISNTTGSMGMATSFATGATTITAGYAGVSGSSVLNVTATDNVMRVTVNGSLCSAGSYPNKPCVSVTVCSPGTSTCRTINDILLDTGSTGLRIFGSLLSGMSFTEVSSGTGLLTNCVQYVDGSAHWGPVRIADVTLGNLIASNVPIQIIDASFGNPSLCGTPDATPVESGFNGILGTGLFNEDCGALCVTFSDNGTYFSCSGATCAETTAPLSDQIKNPVALLPSDNNGFILQFPSVPAGGAVSADGLLILGIGTRTNNTTSGITNSFATDPTYGEFTTVFNSRTYSDSFMDSGSNGLFFNKSFVSALTECSGWYCPSSTQNLSATIEGLSVSFAIGDASVLLSLSNPNNVFSELGGTYSSFDWGLPFFLGRRVYNGIEGKTSGLGTGPYLAY